jgi:hypothetical protein
VLVFALTFLLLFVKKKSKERLVIVRKAQKHFFCAFLLY